MKKLLVVLLVLLALMASGCEQTNTANPEDENRPTRLTITEDNRSADVSVYTYIATDTLTGQKYLVVKSRGVAVTPLIEGGQN